ncbi:MAG: protein phosphatase 2C domain-containing protein [Pseudomonadota bacterium]
MIKEGLLRTYARSHLSSADPQLEAGLIEAFLNSGTFLHLTAVFDKNLASALARFSEEQSIPLAESSIFDAPSVKPFAFDCLQSNAVPAPALGDIDPSAKRLATAGQLEASPSTIAFRLPHGRIGEIYSERLTSLQAPSDAIVFRDISVPSELGLTIDLASGALTGTPQATGEFEISILFSYADNSSPSQSATVTLLVNQNPKLMWKTLPSDQSDIFWKPDQQCSKLAAAGFRLIAASKRGRSHAHVGSYRDDDYLIGHVGATDWLIAVMSDGAGSAKYSRRGSQVICQQAAAHLQKTLAGTAAHAIAEAAAAFHSARLHKPFDPARIETAHQQLHAKLFITVGHAAHHAVKAIHDELAAHPELNASYKDFSSTAMIAACRRFSFGTLCVAYWVGDGALGVYSKTAGITLLGDVDSGEFSGQTRFLDNAEVTADALARRTRFALVDDMTALILMTDGVSDPKFDTEANLSRSAKWDQLWQDIDDPVGLGASDEGIEQRLLSWLDFWSQGNHDDRSIALILPEK